MSKKAPLEVRRAIQESTDSLRTLAARYGLNIKTVQKWRARDDLDDRRRGPKQVPPLLLSDAEQSIIVRFRRHSRLPLDDCLYALQATLPHLKRSTLHRCLQHYGLNQLEPLTTWDGKPLPTDGPALGCLSMYAADIPVDGIAARLYSAIDGNSKMLLGYIYDNRDSGGSATFLKGLIERTPFRVNTIITDSEIGFDIPVTDMASLQKTEFARICAAHGITHHHNFHQHYTEAILKQVMDRQDVRKILPFSYSSLEQAQERLRAYLVDFNLNRRMKVLKGITPFDYIQAVWRAEPELFNHDPQEYRERMRSRLVP